MALLDDKMELMEFDTRYDDFTFGVSDLNGSKVAWAGWDLRDKQFTEIKGIPNFFSKSMFGRTSHLRAASQFMVIIAIIAVVLRMFARRRFRTLLWWDDLCVVGAVFFLFANQLVFCMVDYLGHTSFSWTARMLQEEEDRRVGKIILGLKLTLACDMFYLISIYLVKFSMLFLYGRIAKQTKHITLYLRVTQGVCIGAFILCVLSLFLSCIPVYEFWNLQNENPQCTRRILLTYSSGVSNIITNTLVLLVPVPLLLRASLTFRQKSGVFILYFFGVFVIVASALRFATLLWNVSVPQAIGWSQIEISLAIILACAPMSAKLLLYPLDTERYSATIHRDSGLSQVDTANLIEKFGARSGGPGGGASSSPGQQNMVGSLSPSGRMITMTLPNGNVVEVPVIEGVNVDKVLPRLQTGSVITDVDVGATSSNGNTNRALPGNETIPREMHSPDYNRLRVVRVEVDGHMVWEVRPVSPDSSPV